MVIAIIFFTFFTLAIIAMIAGLANTQKDDFDTDYYEAPSAQAHSPYDSGYYPPMLSMQQGPIFSPDQEFVWDQHRNRWRKYGREGHESIITGILIAIFVTSIAYFLIYLNS